MAKKTVAVDLDGTLLAYDGWKGCHHFGDPLPGAREFVRKLREQARVMIYTTRTCGALNGRVQDLIAAGCPQDRLHDEAFVVAFLRRLIADHLDKHGVEYDEIYVGQGKPLFAALVDDRAVSCQPLALGENAYIIALERVAALLEA